jgi:hypothetical protein
LTSSPFELTPAPFFRRALANTTRFSKLALFALIPASAPRCRLTGGFGAFATGVEVELAENQRVVLWEQHYYAQKVQSAPFPKKAYPELWSWW